MPIQYKIENDFDLGELETLFDLFNHEVIKHRQLAKLDHAEKKITNAELQWHLGHADYLESIKEKLLPKGLKK
jgi:hypothetical protein